MMSDVVEADGALDGLDHFRLPVGVAAPVAESAAPGVDTEAESPYDPQTDELDIDEDVVTGTHTHSRQPPVTPETSTAAAAERGPATPLSYFEMRALLESLEPSMPMSKLRPIIERTKLPVSPGTGGKTRRTKVDILNDVRPTTTAKRVTDERARELVRASISDTYRVTYDARSSGTRA